MSAGERRERIQIKRKIEAERDDGGFDTTLSVIATKFAKVTADRKGGRTEVEIAGALRGTVRYNIEVESRGTDVKTDDIIVWVTNENLVLNVREVRTPPRRALPLEIIAELGVPNSGT